MTKNENIGEQASFILKCMSQGEKSKTQLKKAFCEAYKGKEKLFDSAYMEAKKVIAEYFKADIEELVSEITMHLWELYHKSYKLQDYRECRNVLKEIANLAISNAAATGKTEQKESIFAKIEKLKAS